MPTLIFGQSIALAGWAAKRIPHVSGGGAGGFGPCQAIGVAAGDKPEDELYAVCVYHDYQQHLGTMQISVAARRHFWATPGVIAALLDYPFRQLKVRKLWAAMPSDNHKALRFNRHCGFQDEAVLRHHFAWGRHCVVRSLLAPEYYASRWAPEGERTHGLLVPDKAT